MIETDKDTAIVTHYPEKESLRYWMGTKEEPFKLTIEGNWWEVNDAAIFIENRRKNNVDQTEVLRSRTANKHQNWYNAGKKLKDWGEGIFHAGNSIIMATWLLGKAGVSEIIFAEVRAEETIERKYEENIFQDIMKKIVSEFDIELKHTDKSSQLFYDCGSKPVSGTLDLSRIEPVEIPNRETAFENNVTKILPNRQTVIKPNPQGVGPTVMLNGEGESPRFTSTDLIPNTVSLLPERNVFILNPEEVSLRKLVRVTGNEKGIYLINDKIKNQDISADESVYMKTFVTFAVGERPVKTKNILNRVTEEEKAAMKGMAKKYSGITHV